MRHRADRSTKVRIVDLDALAQGHGGAGDVSALMFAFGGGNASEAESVEGPPSSLGPPKNRY